MLISLTTLPWLPAASGGTQSSAQPVHDLPRPGLADSFQLAARPPQAAALRDALQFPEAQALSCLPPALVLAPAPDSHCPLSLAILVQQDAAQASLPSVNPPLVLRSQGSVPLCLSSVLFCACSYCTLMTIL